MSLLFLDCEFNAFGGKLMSMALVPEDPDYIEFYCEIEMKDQLDPWVAKNVAPLLSTLPVTYSKFQSELSNYLMIFKDDEITIVADWPDDIRYFCEALISGPGERITVPKVMKFELNLNIDYVSKVPHHALFDAQAIRDVYCAK
jgi:hypothetical protein